MKVLDYDAGVVRVIALLLFFASPASGQEKQPIWPPKIDGERHVYKTVGGRELCLWRVQSASGDAMSEGGLASPAIVFFFGGGWTSGSPEQFLPQARKLANRGMVAIVADYRVASRDGVKAVACVEDAKSAIRWIRANALTLGVDASRICAAGGSAGGHIACCTALIEGFDAESEDKSVSSVPNALALFNPAVVLAPLEESTLVEAEQEKTDVLRVRLGVEPTKLSPIHHVRKDLPPCVIFHGEADTTVRIQTVERFTTLMKNAGNRCELNRFPNAPHGFFNLRGENVGQKDLKDTGPNGFDRRREWHETSLRQLDQFFVSLTWLSTEE
ncbi:MAG: alpha/beta hydrolase [Planctomycetota bacterium]